MDLLISETIWQRLGLARKVHTGWDHVLSGLLDKLEAGRAVIDSVAYSATDSPPAVTICRYDIVLCDGRLRGHDRLKPRRATLKRLQRLVRARFAEAEVRALARGNQRPSEPPNPPPPPPKTAAFRNSEGNGARTAKNRKGDA